MSFGGHGGRQLPAEMEEAAAQKRKEFEDMIAKEAGQGGGGGPPKGPRTVVCYICGREFGRSSIQIHQKQCAQKWEEIESQKPPGQRKPLPQPPEVGADATLEERNEAARGAHEDQVMAHCPGCGRTFKDEATMQKHQKVCKGMAGGGPPGSRHLPPEVQASSDAKMKEFEALLAKEGRPSSSGGGGGGVGGPPKGPRTVVCYICGREFGRSSIQIHQKQCAQKWEEIESQKPPGQRKPLPQEPELGAGMTLEERNEAARNPHEEQAMAHCPGCGRTFKDEATLQKHQKVCKGVPFNGAAGGRALPPEVQASADAKMKEFEALLAKEGRAGSSGGGGGGGGGGGPPKGPRTVVCYICGREFGRSSIEIHQKQCAQKWEEIEAQKPPGQRKPLPQAPELGSGLTLEERNEAARNAHEEQAMAHCPGCGRTFKDEATMQKHQKVCNGTPPPGSAAGGRMLPPGVQASADTRMKEFEEMLAKEGHVARGGGSAGSTAPAGPPKGPRTVVCYICGREFGRSSIEIHQKQCAQKWEEIEAQKPPGQRKPLPQAPEVGNDATLEERNEAARSTHEEQAMVHCPGCGRTFKDEATMQKHQKVCKGLPAGGAGARQLPPDVQASADTRMKEFENMIAKEGRAAGGGGAAHGASAVPKGPRTVVCYICGREFGRSSIEIHERQCAQKWEEIEAQKEPGARKPLPQRPSVSDNATLEERNAAARTVHEEQAMVHCPGCSRTFKDEATMHKHQKVCNGC